MSRHDIDTLESSESTIPSLHGQLIINRVDSDNLSSNNSK